MENATIRTTEKTRTEADLSQKFSGNLLFSCLKLKEYNINSQRAEFLK